MSIEFWDCNCFVGTPMRAVYRPAPSSADLIEVMDASGIRKALAWHVAQFDCSAQAGNELLTEAVAESDRLLGCWAILPPVTGEMPYARDMLREAVRPEAIFEEMKRNRIAALRAFPEQHRFLLNRVVFGPFLEEVAERRIPVLLSIERGTLWPAVYALLEDYPNLTCVLCDIGTWGQDRHTWPLLDVYNNVYVETSYLALEASGIAATVNRFGADRLLFGTGFPLRYTEASMLALLHAEVSQSDRHKIASANLDRLVQEARL